MFEVESQGKIRLIIEAQDKATKALNELQKQFGLLTDALRATQAASAATAQGMSWLTNCHVKYVAVAAAGTQIIGAAAAAFAKLNQYMELGAEALKSEEAFGAMAQSIGADADKMTEDMKKAAAGFVDDSHLMQKAAFAMASDIDPDKIPQVFEAARLAARLTGQDVTTSIDSMIQAISTNMPRSLRQMGMISKDQMNLLNQAAAAGVTEINLLDIVMANATIRAAQLGESQDNAAKQIKKFKVELEELKETLGKTLLIAAQKAFGAFQWLASGVLAATAAIPKFMEMVSRLSAFVQDKIGNKDRAAVALRDAAQMQQLYEDLRGAAGELAAKGAANISGTGAEGIKGPSAAEAEKAKANLARLMEDLKRRIAASKGGGETDKLREEWARIERELEADLAKGGLNEYEKKIIDIDRKIEDLKVKAAKLPTEAERATAGKVIASWGAGMKEQVAAEQAREDTLAAREEYEKGSKALAAADKWVTEAQASELQKRKDQVAEAADEQRRSYLEAYNVGILDREEYEQKLTALTLAEKEQITKLNMEYDKTVREAEINTRLAALDLLEKEGTAHRATLAERIELTRELIRSEEEHLATMDKDKDEAAWYAQSDKINAARKSYADLTREMTMTDPFGAMKLAMTDLGNKWTDVGQQMYDVAQSTAQAMQQAFSDFFFDAFTGKLKTLGDYVTSFCNAVSRAVANALSQQMSAGISGGIGQLFSFLSPTPTAATDLSVALAGYHSGGMGGEPTFFRIVPNLDILPRYHRGLGPGERLSVTTDAESTMTPGQRRDFFRLAAAFGARGARPNVEEKHVHVHLTVNALDSRSVAQTLQQHAVQITGIVNQAFNRHGRRGPNG